MRSPEERNRQADGLVGRPGKPGAWPQERARGEGSGACSDRGTVAYKLGEVPRLRSSMPPPTADFEKTYNMSYWSKQNAIPWTSYM